MHLVVGFLGALLMGVCHGENDIFDTNMDTSVEEIPIQCDEDKFCVQPHLCINGTINRFGQDIIRPRTAFPECKLPLECCHNQTQTHSAPKVIPQRDCGKVNQSGVSKEKRIIQHEAELGEFPWILQVKNVALEKHFGGGSLIHPKIALTAAHIVFNKTAVDLSVLAGVWEYDKPSSEFPPQVRNISEIVTHPKFNSLNLRYDIALLFLTHPFTLEDHIGTVCLPPSNFPIEFTNCYATGWGIDVKNKRKSYSDFPKKILLTTEPHNACQSMLRRTRLTEVFRLHKSLMCAGGSAKIDTCQGDGGSALACHSGSGSNRYHQLGIVAWGIDCGEEGVPGVYANLPFLRLWVDKEVTDRKYNTSSYTY